MIRRSFSAVALALGLVACGGESSDPVPAAPVFPGRPATLAELTGPWQATPFLLDGLTRNRVEVACRRDIEMPAGSTAVVMDARGAGVVTVRMSGQNPGSCNALEITRRGEVTGAGGGWRNEQREVLANLDGARLGQIETQGVAGGSLTVEGWSIYGRAGAAVTRVVVLPGNHPPVTATLANGWFAAWWPARPGEPQRDGDRFPPFLVQAYDAMGVLTDEVRR